jgi:RimJ/RimL family protein N-acetyltransferase
LRLKSLLTDPTVLTSNHAYEANHPDEHWQKMLADNASRQIFGLFDGDKLVGATAVRAEQDDPSAVRFWGSWLEKSWRGLGLTEMFYQARFDWVRQRPHIRRIVISVRASNHPSRRAIERHGFTLVKEVPHKWSDGVTEADCVYEMLLDAPVRS